MAAHRGGIETVLLPKRNEEDLKGIPNDVYKRGVEICVGLDHVGCAQGIWPDYLREHGV